MGTFQSEIKPISVGAWGGCQVLLVKDITRLVRTYCGHTLAIQSQMEETEEWGRGGMGFRA